jgi:hypothetical protein
MPTLKGVAKFFKPVTIQEDTEDESTNLLELKNHAGETVYSVSKTGVPSQGGGSSLPAYTVVNYTTRRSIDAASGQYDMEQVIDLLCTHLADHAT